MRNKEYLDTEEKNKHSEKPKINENSRILANKVIVI